MPEQIAAPLDNAIQLFHALMPCTSACFGRCLQQRVAAGGHSPRRGPFAELHRRRRHRINPKLAQTVRVLSADFAGPRLGEMTTGGYTLLQAPRPKQRWCYVHQAGRAESRLSSGAADLFRHAAIAARLQ